MASVVENLFSIKSDIQLKALAIMVFAGIALIMCYPLVAYPNSQIGAPQVTVITLSMFGIIIVILADRIVSLNVSKDKLNITLSGLKENFQETIEYVREDLQEALAPPDVAPAVKTEIHGLQEQVNDLETVVSREKNGESVEEMLENAKKMGEAMGMLREIMKNYHKFDK